MSPPASNSTRAQAASTGMSDEPPVAASAVGVAVGLALELAVALVLKVGLDVALADV